MPAARNLLLVPIAIALSGLALTAQVRLEERHGSHLPIGATNWSDMVAADFNGDGLLDLVVTRDGGHYGPFADARLFLQGPDLTFGTPISIPCEPARHIAVGDIDGDGDLDLLFGGGEYTYATPGGEPSSIARNDGGGLSWSTPSYPSYDQETSGCQLADIDGDGDLDALLFQERPTLHNVPLHVWQNDGAGNFVDVTTTQVAAALSFATSAAAFDADSDGDIDVVYQLGWPDQMRLLENDGNGSFTEHATWNATHSGNIYAAADADNDGDVDLYVDNAVLLNDGTGTLTVAGGGNRCLDGQVVDLNGDGLLDVCGLEYATERPVVYLATGPTSFQNVTNSWIDSEAAHSPFPANLEIYNTTHVCAADFEGDGYAEMLFATTSLFYSSNTVGVPPRFFVNAAGTGFVDANPQPMREFQKLAWQMGAADVDGDHDTDLLFNGAVLRRNQRGNFVEQTLPSNFTTDGTQHRHYRDFDGDGDNDVIIVWGIYEYSLFTPFPITYQENLGNGNFVDRTASNVPAGLQLAGSAIASADIDDDGDLDVMIASHSHPLLLMVNQGNGVFVDASNQLPMRNDVISALPSAMLTAMVTKTWQRSLATPSNLRRPADCSTSTTAAARLPTPASTCLP